MGTRQDLGIQADRALLGDELGHVRLDSAAGLGRVLVRQV
jgi:hypothetical protein